MKLTTEQWFKLPLELRQRWWRETNYGKQLPAEKLVHEVETVLKQENPVNRRVKIENDGWIDINGRRYPSNYPPGTHPALDEAWEILDTIQDGAIPETLRIFLAGVIAGKILKYRGNKDDL
jgi:hypothetical protein